MARASQSCVSRFRRCARNTAVRRGLGNWTPRSSRSFKSAPRGYQPRSWRQSRRTSLPASRPHRNPSRVLRPESGTIWSSDTCRFQSLRLCRSEPGASRCSPARVGGATGPRMRRRPSSLRATRPGGRCAAWRAGTGSPRRSCSPGAGSPAALECPRRRPCLCRPWSKPSPGLPPPPASQPRRARQPGPVMGIEVEMDGTRGSDRIGREPAGDRGGDPRR